MAVAHFNTEHPHVHVALRGVGSTGKPVRLSRDYIREGIRHIAEDHCTRQLGFRTQFDAAEAQRREVHQIRFTSLDRIIRRDADLVHGEDEGSGKSYMLLEGTDARVHYVRYTPEIEAARNRGGLKLNSFIRLRNVPSDGRPKLKIAELGDAESILRNKLHLREAARRLAQRGIVPQDEGWKGWLGRYQRALCDAAVRPKRAKTHDFGR